MPLPREVKVGAFVAVGLAVAGLVVFLIGDERRAFEKKVQYYAVFDDVEGLTRGAPIRMGGVDVGQVGDVSYDPNVVKDIRLHVRMDIVRSEARRIRKDSVVTIANKGLLGDKMVVIKVGTPSEPAMEPGSTLPTEKGMDLEAVANRISTITEKAEMVVTNLQKTTDTFADPDVREDLRTAVKSLSHILKSVDEGDGYVTRLLKDPKEANRVSAALENMQHATGELDRALARADAVMARVQQGPGFAHDVLYGEGPSDALAQLGRASGELATTLEGMRKGNGLAHSILYGDDATQQLIGDLNSITKDVKGIVEDVRNGKGTVGALLVDPSVYEDIKSLLGNVERNKTLRALVRYSIRQDEKAAPTVENPDPGRPGHPAPGAPEENAHGGGSFGAEALGGGRASAP